MHVKFERLGAAGQFQSRLEKSCATGMFVENRGRRHSPYPAQQRMRRSHIGVVSSCVFDAERYRLGPCNESISYQALKEALQRQRHLKAFPSFAPTVPVSCL